MILWLSSGRKAKLKSVYFITLNAPNVKLWRSLQCTLTWGVMIMNIISSKSQKYLVKWEKTLKNLSSTPQKKGKVKKPASATCWYHHPHVIPPSHNLSLVVPYVIDENYPRWRAKEWKRASERVVCARARRLTPRGDEFSSRWIVRPSCVLS